MGAAATPNFIVTFHDMVLLIYLKNEIKNDCRTDLHEHYLNYFTIMSFCLAGLNIMKLSSLLFCH